MGRYAPQRRPSAGRGWGVTPIKAWHFLPRDRRLRWGPDDRQSLEEGEVSVCDKTPVLCECGCHGSERILDALTYAPGPIACRVEIWGEVAQGADKLAGTHRRILRMADATNVLHEFACRCAEDVLSDEPDPRCVAAIQAKRDWMAGKISDEKLVAAKDAAKDTVAWAATWDTAWVAARGAAWAAARGTAWDTTWDTVRNSQESRIVGMVEDLFRRAREGGE